MSGSRESPRVGTDGRPITGAASRCPTLRLSSVELCRPILVCPLEGPEGVRGRECFLWVTTGHLFEVELQAARTLQRLELRSLEAAEVEAETQTQSEQVPEVSGKDQGFWEGC